MRIAAAVLIWFCWPALDADFWAEFALFAGGLLLAFAFLAIALFRSRNALVKVLGVVPAVAALAVAGALIAGWLELARAGATIGLLQIEEICSPPRRRS